MELKQNKWNLIKSSFLLKYCKQHLPRAATLLLAINPTFILKYYCFLPFKKNLSVTAVFRCVATRLFSRIELSVSNHLKMNVIDHVRDMAAAGLHSNVRIISSLLLTMSTNNPWVRHYINTSGRLSNYWILSLMCYLLNTDMCCHNTVSLCEVIWCNIIRVTIASGH